MRLSHTVSSVSRLSSCGTTPMRARISGPSTRGVEAEHAQLAARTRRHAADHPHRRRLARAVRPRKPNASPGSIAKSMPSTATNEPKRFVSARASIIGSVMPSDASCHVYAISPIFVATMFGFLRPACNLGGWCRSGRRPVVSGTFAVATRPRRTPRPRRMAHADRGRRGRRRARRSSRSRSAGAAPTSPRRSSAPSSSARTDSCSGTANGSAATRC